MKEMKKTEKEDMILHPLFICFISIPSLRPLDRKPTFKQGTIALNITNFIVLVNPNGFFEDLVRNLILFAIVLRVRSGCYVLGHIILQTTNDVNQVNNK